MADNHRYEYLQGQAQALVAAEGNGLDEAAEQIAAEPDEKSEVVEAVMALSVKYKEVVWLHYYEGYQTDEIAEMLHRPPSTVRGQLRDARAKLKLTLGGERI